MLLSVEFEVSEGKIEGSKVDACLLAMLAVFRLISEGDTANGQK